MITSTKDQNVGLHRSIEVVKGLNSDVSAICQVVFTYGGIQGDKNALYVTHADII